MEDKFSHHLDNKDRDSVPEDRKSNSKVLVNDLDCDNKEETKQSSPIILSSLANTIDNINNKNSNLHSMPLLDLNTWVGAFGITFNDTNSNTIDIKSTNHKCKPTKKLLG